MIKVTKAMKAMKAMSQSERASQFKVLHQAGRPLVLPNAWDAMSARVFEAAGFPAIGTTSAGMAFQAGFPDGERLPAPELLSGLARIVRAVAVPVTADLEAGYADEPSGVADLVRQALAAGIVGINLEDWRDGQLVPLERQVARLAACRAAADGAGVPLFLNARTDVYWHEVGPSATRLDHAVRRGAAYLAAGADGVFVPGTEDEFTVRALALGLAGPLNVLAGPQSDASRLAALGVARISTGSGPVRAVMGLLAHLALEWKTRGTFGGMGEGAIPYGEANRLFDTGGYPPRPPACTLGAGRTHSESGCSPEGGVAFVRRICSRASGRHGANRPIPTDLLARRTVTARLVATRVGSCPNGARCGSRAGIRASTSPGSLLHRVPGHKAVCGLPRRHAAAEWYRLSQLPCFNRPRAGVHAAHDPVRDPLIGRGAPTLGDDGGQRIPGRRQALRRLAEHRGDCLARPAPQLFPAGQGPGIFEPVQGPGAADRAPGMPPAPGGASV